MWAVLHGLHVTTDALANLIFLGRNALAVGQQRFVFTQIDRDIGSLESAHDTTDDVADSVLKLDENQLLLGPPHLLHQRLLGILSRNTAVLGVDHAAEFPRRSDCLLGRLHKRFLDSSDKDITADALFPLPIFQNG